MEDELPHLPPLTVFFHHNIIEVLFEAFCFKGVNGNQHLWRNGLGETLQILRGGMTRRVAMDERYVVPVQPFTE